MEKRKGRIGPDKTNFESPKKEVLEKNESEVQGKELEQSKAHEEVLAPKQKDQSPKRKLTTILALRAEKTRKLSTTLTKMKSKKRNLAKEVENVELKSLLVKTF